MKRTEFKGTKGKWNTRQDRLTKFGGFEAVSITAGGTDFQESHIAQVIQSPYKGTEITKEEMEANAKLISSAPEMLEALQLAVLEIERLKGNTSVIAQGRKVIEKAL